MRYVSLFSGIEAATCAWEPLGWEPVSFSEIEPFPCAVLQHHYPEVPNLGDVTKIDWSDFLGRNERPDILVGGKPLPKLQHCRREGKPRGRVKAHVRVHTGCC